MPTLKFEPKVSASAQEALEPYVRPLYDRPGLRLMFIGELTTTERTEPSPGSEKTPAVKVRITSLEIPNQDQEGFVREAQRALFLQRTARGTLDDATGQLELSPDTLRLVAGQLHAMEVARLRAALEHWAGYARRATHATGLVTSEILHELATVADGLTAALTGARPDDD
ncbi:hypothetical protein ACFSL4_01480 [Streptomyces caeni]|uniref:DNA-binding protein n=1 Tax=Streptomyces caeni TaxID=2307231 RepID=A0ABW4IJL2_9ACTN